LEVKGVKCMYAVLAKKSETMCEDFTKELMFANGKGRLIFFLGGDKVKDMSDLCILFF
jgi:hypothetical protein